MPTISFGAPTAPPGENNRTLGYGTDYRFVGGASGLPTVTATANAVSVLAYAVMADEKILITAHLDVKAQS